MINPNLISKYKSDRIANASLSLLLRYINNPRLKPELDRLTAERLLRREKERDNTNG